MQYIYDFFKDIYPELLKLYEKAKNSAFLRTIIRNITNRSNINIVLESLILCLTYTINTILNFDDVTLRLTILENIVLVLSYFSAYYFVPKRNFEFKIFVLYLSALAIMSPVIFSVHTAQEIAKTYEFMLLASCVIGLVFRSDVVDSQKIPVILVLEHEIPEAQIAEYSNTNYIVAIITKNKALSEQYRVFESLDETEKWINFIKIVPIFSFPLHLIYIHNRDISQAADVFKFANKFGISIIDEGLNKIELSQFVATDPAIEESVLHDLEKIFTHKKVLIEYDGNPVLKMLINTLSDFCYVVVSCGAQKDIYNTPRVVVRMAPVEALLSEPNNAFDFVFAVSCTNPHFFSEENLNYAVTYNAMRYINIADTCNAANIKNLFLISNNDALKANTWSGASQRIAELYIQNMIDSGKYKHVTPIRLPKTLLDLEEAFSGDETTYCEADEIYGIFIKLIVHITRQNRTSSGVYSIIPTKHIDVHQALSLVYEMGKGEKRISESVLPSFDDLQQHTELANVYVTEFISGHQYDMSDLKEMMNSRSIIELTERLLSLLKSKMNPFG